MAGIPFIGENGFYPRWAKIGGRWLFQRTLVAVGGGMDGMAELSASAVPESKEIIIWMPAKRIPLLGLFLGRIHQERETALHQLAQLKLVCYNDNCSWKPESHDSVKAAINESGVEPEKWRLSCPSCHMVVGPDLSSVQPEPVIQRWLDNDLATLEDPAASAVLEAAPVIDHLPRWIKRNDPSLREIAYVGQQMWPSIHEMINYCIVAETKKIPANYRHLSNFNAERLSEKILESIEQLEAKHALLDPRLGDKPVPFGFQNESWLFLRAKIIPGDELWRFSSPPETWQNRWGRCGIALVRDRGVIDYLVTKLN